MSATTSRRLRLLILFWCALSTPLLLQPPGVGGVARAVDGVLLMVLGPGLAAALLMLEHPATRRAPGLVAVAALAFSLSLLLLTSMVLLLLDVYSVTAVVVVVVAVTDVLAVWPVRSRAGAQGTS